MYSTRIKVRSGAEKVKKWRPAVLGKTFGLSFIDRLSEDFFMLLLNNTK